MLGVGDACGHYPHPLNLRLQLLRDYSRVIYHNTLSQCSLYQLCARASFNRAYDMTLLNIRAFFVSNKKKGGRQGTSWHLAAFALFYNNGTFLLVLTARNTYVINKRNKRNTGAT
jgi:hypothetical protein